MNEDQKQPVASATKTPASADTKSTEPVKTSAPVKPQTTQTTQPTVQATGPKQSTATPTPEPVKPQPAQTTEQATSAKQPIAPVKAAESVKPQTVQPTTAVTSPEQIKPQTTQTTNTAKATEPVASQPTQPTQSTAPVKTPEPVKPQITQPTEVTKLSDVIPTSKVWISGLIGNRQIDCLGPIEIPLEIGEPTYPFTPVPSNPNYTNQVFDYDTSTWVPTDAKSQGQQLTDLTKEVADLQQTITKHEKDAETSQAISLQQMQMLMSITEKLDALTKKEGVK